MAAASALLDLRARALGGASWSRRWASTGAASRGPPRRGASSVSCGRRWCAASASRGPFRSSPVRATASPARFGAGVTGPGPVSEMAGSSTCLNTVIASRSRPRRDPLSERRGRRRATSPRSGSTPPARRWTGSRRSCTGPVRAPAPTTSSCSTARPRRAPGSDGLLFIPVLGDGERDDPTLRGALTGLSIRHDRKARSPGPTLEGVAFGIRAHLEALGRATARHRVARVRRGRVPGELEPDQGGRARHPGVARPRRLRPPPGSPCSPDSVSGCTGTRPRRSRPRCRPDGADRARSGATTSDTRTSTSTTERSSARRRSACAPVASGPSRRRTEMRARSASTPASRSNAGRGRRTGRRWSRNDLGLDLVELSLDLIEGTDTFAGRRDAVERTRAALDANGLRAHAPFHRARRVLARPAHASRRGAARGAHDWYREVVDLTAALGAARPAVMSAR